MKPASERFVGMLLSSGNRAVEDSKIGINKRGNGTSVTG
jgi:hypothetical protein